MSNEKQLQIIGSELILVVHALSNVMALYDSNNNAVVRQIDALVEIAKRAFETTDEIRLTLRSDEFFINGSLLKVDAQLYMRAKEVSELLEKFEWNDLRIDKTVQRSDFEKFVLDFSKCIRKEQSGFTSKQYGGISGRKSKGSSAAAFRFEPSRMAIWLVAGLLEVVETLYVSHEKGESPSLLPIRRSLQMIIDNMKEYNGIYQMLSAFRHPKIARKESQTRVAMTIDVIGFAAYLGRNNVEIMELALAAILGGLNPTGKAIESVNSLFGFKGLGESALGVVLILHDARAGLEGKKGMLAGEVLQMVERYHLYLNQHPTHPLPKLIFELLESEPSQMMQLFARYKGPFPIGSFIQVDGEIRLVVGQSNRPNGKQRPIVVRLQGTQILEVSDLSKQLGAKIESVQSLQEQSFSLEDLVM